MAASAGRTAQPRRSPGAPAGRAQPEQRHAGRASLAGRGRSRRRGRRLRPAGPRHRWRAREGHGDAARHDAGCSSTPMKAIGERTPAGAARILRRAIYPTLRGQNLAAVGVQQRAVLLAPENQHGTSPLRDSASNRLGHAWPRRRNILTFRGATAGPEPGSRLRTDRISRRSRPAAVTIRNRPPGKRATFPADSGVLHTVSLLHGWRTPDVWFCTAAGEFTQRACEVTGQGRGDRSGPGACRHGAGMR
jgi:hypothetical protein